MNTDRILSPKDVSEMLQISMPTCYELFKKEGFPAVRVGKQYRVLESQLFQWMKANSSWIIA